MKWYANGRLEFELGCEKGLAAKYFATDKDFVDDLERWWNAYRGVAYAKRLQAPPSIVVSGKPFKDQPMCGAYYTQAYESLKNILFKHSNN